MAQEFAIAAPTTEEMTRVGAAGGGGLVAGVVEGVLITTVAPKLGGLKVPFEWGTLIGVPVIGAALALMTKGILSDLGLGIAAGGGAMLGSTMPTMLEEFTVARPGAGSQKQPNSGVKQLPPGSPRSPLAAQQAAARAGVGLEF